MAKLPGDERRNHTRKIAPLTPVPDEQEADVSLDKTQAVPVSSDTRLNMQSVRQEHAAPRQQTARMSTPAASAKKRKKRAARPHSIFKPRTKNPNFVLSVAASTIRLLFVLILCVCLAGLGALIGIAKAYVDTAPTLDLAALDAQDKTSFIYDAEGNLITDYKGTEDRVMVSIGEIPVMLRNAFIAVEDARFYEHNGVDVKRIVGALVSD